MPGDVENLIFYSSEYNEQIDSKLCVLLAQEVIWKLNKKASQRKMQVRGLIRKLEKNQNPDGYWGWWHRSANSLFVTNHVAIFFENLRQGKYYYELELLPRYSGMYSLAESVMK